MEQPTENIRKLPTMVLELTQQQFPIFVAEEISTQKLQAMQIIPVLDRLMVINKLLNIPFISTHSLLDKVWKSTHVQTD